MNRTACDVAIIGAGVAGLAAAGMLARAALARPVEDTIFFAGEATDLDGHSGTVDGAIASDIRAASAVL